MTEEREFRALAVARIACELLTSRDITLGRDDVRWAVTTARAIVAEAMRQESDESYQKQTAERISHEP